MHTKALPILIALVSAHFFCVHCQLQLDESWSRSLKEDKADAVYYISLTFVRASFLQFQDAITSLMQWQVVSYAIIWWLGASFCIQNFWKSLDNTKATWMSMYIACSACLVVVFFCFEITPTIKIFFAFNDLSRAFSLSFVFILRCLVCFKVLVNCANMATGTNRLLEFFRKSSTFEKNHRALAL